MDDETRGTRARPMSRDDRRAAIALATVPLLEEHGSGVSTRQIAVAAGVAEGTLFRAFDDKVELLTAAAERALDPAEGIAAVDALPPAGSLAAELVQVAEVVAERGRRVRRIMVAVHAILASDEGRRAAAVRRARGADALGEPLAARPPRADTSADPHEPHSPHHPHRPHHRPGAHVAAFVALRAAVARRVEPYRDDLRVEPERLAQLLLTVLPGLGPPGIADETEIPHAEVVDVLLHGVVRPTG